MIAALGDIPDGGGLVVSAPSGQVLLARTGDTVTGHSASCTHEGEIIGGNGVCPRHGSMFDVATGAVLQGPAQSPLPAVAVEVADGEVYAG